MGKSARKNKEKKKDFQKVKLKAGKTKPKADNFTDTTFKSRAIQIREQLKSSDAVGDVPVTQRKQNIQELLCQMSHYNSSVRCSAVQGIKSLLTPSPALLREHLPALVAALSATVTDKDAAVRQAGSALLRLVMDATPAAQISPFFAAVCVHLCCAMTHIQEDVQLDSLVVMETILQCYPGLIAPHSKELLTNFIHLISQQRGKLGSSGSLRANPSGKLAGQKWRLKVLQMMQKFLEVIKGSKENESLSAEGGNTTRTVVVGSVPGKPTYAPILKANGALNGKQRPFILRTDQSASGPSSGDFLSSPAALMNVSRTLVPLLLQCWGEVNLLPTPNQGKSPRGGRGGSLTIGPREEGTLGCVVAVLQTVWALMRVACREKGDNATMDELGRAYQRKVEQHFLQGFPYASHQHAPSEPSRTRRTKSADAPSPGPGSAPVNLAACDLLLSVSTVAAGNNNNKPRPCLRIVGEFVEGVLREDVGEGECPLSQQDQLVLMGVVKKLLDRTADENDTTSLVDALFVYFKRAHPLSQQKLRALKTLQTICFDGARPGEGNRSSRFFESLGQLVIAAKDSPHRISQEALRALLVAASRGYAEAVDCIAEHLPDWLGGEDAVMDSLDKPTQHRLLECLYYLPSIGSRLQACLTRHCCRPDADVTVPVYLLANRCFENVFGTSGRLPLSQADFIDMLLTISMGQSHNDLASLQTSIAADRTTHPTLGNTSLVGTVDPYFHILHDVTDVGQLERASTVNKMVHQVYKRHPRQEMVVKACVSRMGETMTTCQYLPMRTTVGLLHHASAMQNTEVPSSSSSSIPSAKLYPDLDRWIGTVAFLAVYQTVLDCKGDLERGAVTVATTLWQLAVDCVATCRDGVADALLQQAVNTSRVNPSKQVGAVVTRLLQTNSLKQRLQRHSDKLLAIVKCIEDQPTSERDTRWFAELKYEVRLLARESSPDR